MLLVSSNLLATEVPPDLYEYNKCGTGPITTNSTVCPGEKDFSPGSGASSASTLHDWTHAGIFLLVAAFVGYLLFVLLTCFEIKSREQKADEERRGRREREDRESPAAALLINH